jgi:hypothetical protein
LQGSYGGAANIVGQLLASQAAISELVVASIKCPADGY